MRPVSLSQSIISKTVQNLRTCGGSCGRELGPQNCGDQIVPAAIHYSHVATIHVNETNPQIMSFKRINLRNIKSESFQLNEVNIFSWAGIVHSHNVLKSIKLEH